jgi:hypothetical protein
VRLVLVLAEYPFDIPAFEVPDQLPYFFLHPDTLLIRLPAEKTFPGGESAQTDGRSFL